MPYIILKLITLSTQIIFEFYLVKNQASKLDIFKLHNRLHPSEQKNGCFLTSDGN